jgi:hypothetical protein
VTWPPPRPSSVAPSPPAGRYRLRWSAIITSPTSRRCSALRRGRGTSGPGSTGVEATTPRASSVAIRDRLRPSHGLKTTATGQRFLEGFEAVHALRRDDVRLRALVPGLPWRTSHSTPADARGHRGHERPGCAPHQDRLSHKSPGLLMPKHVTAARTPANVADSQCGQVMGSPRGADRRPATHTSRTAPSGGHRHDPAIAPSKLPRPSHYEFCRSHAHRVGIWRRTRDLTLPVSMPILGPTSRQPCQTHHQPVLREPHRSLQTAPCHLAGTFACRNGPNSAARTPPPSLLIL